MVRVTSDKVVYRMSAANPPAVKVESGETVVLETLDCFENQISDESCLLSGIDWDHINPATGPVYVNGALPGDLLKVEILDICLAPVGTMTATPGEGAVGDVLTEEKTRRISVTGGKVLFNDKLMFDMSPMIGVIGTAPVPGEEIPTGTPGCHGGNMDNKRIGIGSVLYFPVNTEGALFAAGDMHALMADGEVLVCGLEIPGEITARLTVVKGVDLPVPVVKTGEELMTVASAETLDQAAMDATHNMMKLIADHTSLDPQEAGMLLSLKGDLRICQIVDPMKTARMEFPLAVLEQYGFQLP